MGPHAPEVINHLTATTARWEGKYYFDTCNDLHAAMRQNVMRRMLSQNRPGDEILIEQVVVRERGEGNP